MYAETYNNIFDNALDDYRYRAVYTDGSILCDGGVVVYPSDKRIKFNIKQVDYKNELRLIKNLNPISYVRKISKKQEKGFLAQEVKKILPEAVSVDKDFVPTIYDYVDYEEDNDYVKLIFKENHNFNNNLTKEIHGNIIYPIKLKLCIDKSTYTYEILKILNEKEILIDKEFIEIINGHKLSQSENQNPDNINIFIYGPFVTDFYSLDYKYISLTNIGAFKQLIKKYKSIKSKFKMEKDRNLYLKKRAKSLIDKYNNLIRR